MADKAKVIEEFGPHPVVEEVAYGMFGTADVPVYLSPVVGCLAAAKHFLVMGVHIPKEIPATAGITGHCVRRQVTRRPACPIGQGAFAFRARSLFCQRPR